MTLSLLSAESRLPGLLRWRRGQQSAAALFEEGCRSYSCVQVPQPLSLDRRCLLRVDQLVYKQQGRRNIGWVPAAIRSVLKLRYLLLGGAIGGGASVARQYEEWKKNLPDTEWIKNALPDVDVNKFRHGLVALKDSVKGKVGEMQMDPSLKLAGWDKFQEFKIWFDDRLDKAVQIAEEEEEREEEEKRLKMQKLQEELKNFRLNLPANLPEAPVVSAFAATSATESQDIIMKDELIAGQKMELADKEK